MSRDVLGRLYKTFKIIVLMINLSWSKPLRNTLDSLSFDFSETFQLFAWIFTKLIIRNCYHFDRRRYWLSKYSILLIWFWMFISHRHWFFKKTWFDLQFSISNLTFWNTVFYTIISNCNLWISTLSVQEIVYLFFLYLVR